MKPVDKIIAFWGGAIFLARDLGIAPTVVYGWKRKGFVPAWWQSRVLKKGREKGYPITEKDFFEEEGDINPLKVLSPHSRTVRFLS